MNDVRRYSCQKIVAEKRPDSAKEDQADKKQWQQFNSLPRFLLEGINHVFYQRCEHWLRSGID
jgi:hypothetical protein